MYPTAGEADQSAAAIFNRSDEQIVAHSEAMDIDLRMISQPAQANQRQQQIAINNLNRDLASIQTIQTGTIETTDRQAVGAHDAVHR